MTYNEFFLDYQLCWYCTIDLYFFYDMKLYFNQFQRFILHTAVATGTMCYLAFQHTPYISAAHIFLPSLYIPQLSVGNLYLDFTEEITLSNFQARAAFRLSTSI